jgi:ABC-type ATPase with predicted acetyltransferase domain
LFTGDVPAQTWMKRITFLLLFCPLLMQGQPKTVVEKKFPQLVYLNSFEETTRLRNEEFERANTEAEKNRRKEALRAFADSSNVLIPGDTYAVGIDEKNVLWMNETLRRICEGQPDKHLVVVDAKTLPNYDVENYRYLLKYKYVFDKGDPINSKMVFYYYDRVEHKALMDSRTLAGKNTYFPFFYYKGEKSYPFYGVIRSSRIKKEWDRFFRNL